MKNFFIFLVIALLFTSFVNAEPLASWNTETGTTTNDTVTVKTLNTARGQDVSMLLKNTGGNSLNFQFAKYISSGGKAYIWDSGTLQADSSMVRLVTHLYYQIKINVESTADGSHTTYELDWIKEE